MKSYTQNVRISPKKLNVIAYAIRGMEVRRALDMLRFMPKKWAEILYKWLSSAVANAVHNDSQDAGTLLVGAVVIGQWIVYKRGNPISRGRSHRILKRTSNVQISLSVK